MTATASETGSTVLRADAALEGVLTLGTVALAYRVPATGGWAVPTWLGRPWLIVIAVLLAVAALALGRLAEHADPAALRAVGGANGVTAVVLLGWAALDAGAGLWLRVTVAVVALALVVLAGAQLRLARR